MSREAHTERLLHTLVEVNEYLRGMASRARFHAQKAVGFATTGTLLAGTAAIDKSIAEPAAAFSVSFSIVGIMEWIAYIRTRRNRTDVLKQVRTGLHKGSNS